MDLKDIKYTIAYITPITGFISLAFNGIFSFTSVVVLFLFIPIAEQLLPGRTDNLSAEAENHKLQSIFFDILLYLNIPILFGLIFYYLNIVAYSSLPMADLLGKSMALGINIGVIGINVAHEIGHRNGLYNQISSQLLLLPALYMHFNIEHNKGHHKNVATPEDPASSRKNENFYTFWFRTVFYSYLSAWRIENNERRRSNKPVFALSNKMIQFTIIQIAFLTLILLVFNWSALLWYVLCAVSGFTLLELVNYIEHYGLVRSKLPSGKYEAVAPHHSWNSNHELGRIMLYELTRHSDHHYKSTRKYQVLRHFDDSPQLPFGYPASIIMAMFPPIWFSIMNRQLKKYSVGVN